MSKGKPLATFGEHAMHRVSVLGVAKIIARNGLNDTEWE
jgi:hypothetical protein